MSTNTSSIRPVTDGCHPGICKRRGCRSPKIILTQEKRVEYRGREALAQMIQDVQDGKIIAPAFFFMMSAAGDGFKMRTKAPIMNTSAAGGSRFITAQSSLK